MTWHSEKRTVAVLGGTGWIGRHVCEAFAHGGYRVVVIARNPVAHTRGHAFVGMDLRRTTPRDLARVLRAHDTGVVVNAVDAMNATDGWDHDHRSLHEGNVGQVERLLEALAGWDRPPRLIHLGTVHEYGDVPRPRAVSEDTVPAPANDYARTRLAGSKAVVAAADAGTLEAVVLRLVNACGPHPSPASFPGRLLDRVRTRRGRPAEETFTVDVARAHRDYADVRDLARAVFLAAETEDQGYAIPVGSGTATAMEDFVRAFADAAGIPDEAVRPLPSARTGLGGSWVLADPEPADRILGWSARIGLTDSLRAMCESDLSDASR
ncbi:NAD(P)-dependent oxidoreductase [Nocardiopsis sp. MG754419]|uniref:NAD-dependent epimerase/dehydratase family protein n=1 Tax=Nocardiopsis sp. MG754419 TaxID=2259865 RepID=UPI001BAC4F20|nr:NAD(P)-dependent oxidoreductase [Nocardiopsis sp. MG754419]MBR8745259.1 NAD(P)-dependent oxidoreductase [Nocardiopsis sp. MG754419]